MGLSSRPRAQRRGLKTALTDRRHRRTGGLQQAPRQHDDIVGFPRPKPRQGRRRWSAAARNRCRSPVRCTGRVVASASAARPRSLTRHVPRSALSTVHNRLLAGSSPASPTTQSCAIPVSWRVRNSLWLSVVFAGGDAGDRCLCRLESAGVAKNAAPVSGLAKLFPGGIRAREQRPVRMSAETGLNAATLSTELIHRLDHAAATEGRREPRAERERVDARAVE
jgi:hypothetical protein